MRKILLSTLLLLFSICGFAYDCEVDGIYYNLNKADYTASVTYKSSSDRGYSGVVHIPEEVVYNGTTYSVTSIGESAFAYCRGLTEVTIPNSVTSIGGYAFSGCSGLTEVTIPNSVTSIGGYAFSECSGLTEVTIPNNVTSIGNCAFKGCSGLTEVTIPNSVTSIGSSAFYGCSGLTELTIGNSVTSIGGSAFSGCSGLTELTIPNSVTSIGGSAFSGCSGLTELTLSDGEDVLDLLSSSFFDCPIEKLYLGRDVSSSSSYPPFRDNKSLIELTIGNSVTSIGKSVFSGCSGYKIKSYATTPPILEETLDAESLEVPMQTTFQYAKSDYWKEIPQIYTVKDNVRYYPIPFYQEGDGLVSINNEQEDIEVAENVAVEIKPIKTMENVYLVLYDSKDVTADIIRDGHYTFLSSPYHQDNVIKTVAYPQTVVTVSSSGTLLDKVGIENIDNIYCLKVSGDLNGTDILAIRKMTNLHLLDMEDANIVNGGVSYYQNYVTSENEIGASFFQDRTNLTKILLPKTVTSIGRSAFEDCRGLTEVTIPNSVTSIGEYAFSGCSGLTEVTIPNSVTSIGNYAFYGCSGLTELTIGNSVTSIGGHAFSGCSGLTKVYISDLSAWCKISFSTSSSNPLYYAHHLYLNGEEVKKLVIPNSIISIGEYAFYGCSGLMEVTIPNSVTTIGRYAFRNCSGLTEVTIPNSVTSIGGDAFYGCTSLTSVTSLNTTPPKIDSSTFSETTEQNATLHVPAGCKTIYWLHPYWENFYQILEDAVDGIEQVGMDQHDSQHNVDGIYTINGVKVSTTNVSDLPAGIYIVNGKKVVVK